MRKDSSDISWKAVVLNYILRLTAKRWFQKLADETSVEKLTKDIFNLRKLFEKLFSNKTKLKKCCKKIHIHSKCDGLYISYPNANKTILYLHGGGYMIGSAESYSNFGIYLSQFCKVNVLLVNYRLVPENTLSCAIDDAVQSYQYLISKMCDSNTVFIMGDSAGGGLALSAAVKLRDMKIPLPKGIICFSPWTDLLLKNASHQTNKKHDCCLVMPKEFILFQGVDLSDPYISPLYGDLTGLPDILIQVGDTEILLDDSTLFAQKAISYGVNVTLEIFHNLPHGIQFFGEYVPEGKQALLNVSKFISARLDH